MTRRAPKTGLALETLLLLALASTAYAQSPEERASNPKHSLEPERKALKWDQPAAPVKIVGPIYFVGTQGLSSWLLTTPQGHILMNTGLPGSGSMIAESIRQLGFRPEEIKLIVFCHAHVDHVGALAELRKLSGARVLVMEQEAELLQSGGALDFRYGKDPEFRFEPVRANGLVHDGDRVTVGDVVLTARLTPGHTRGTTTWTTRVLEGGKAYNVVFPDGTGISPGDRLVVQPSYPDIESDYWRTFGVLEGLKPDIWLTPHPEASGFEAKRARSATEGAAAWVDPGGYATWLAAQRQKFEAQLKAERAAPAPRK
jgi:metallo-beta-lactamase class B